MKTLPVLFLSLALAGSALAQDADPKFTATSRAYHEYRKRCTPPSYHLQKMTTLAKSIKPTTTGDMDNTELSPAKFNALNFNERFTYCMVHPEDFSQNCDPMPAIVGEEHKIFAYIADGFDQQTWSQKQRDFFHHNRSKVIKLIRSTMKAHHRVGADLKAAIVELDAYELIPDILAIYNLGQKDHDDITVCMLMMKDGKFGPFLNSSTYKKFYGDNANYQSFDVANAANKKLMEQRAMAYYRSKR